MPSFDPKDIAAAASKQSLSLGWFRFLTTDAKLQIAKSGHYMIVTRNEPLTDPDDPDSAVSRLSVRNNLVMPFDNPDVEDQKAPNTTGLMGQALRAYGYDLPQYPRVIDGVLTYNGEEIEKAEEDACRQEAVQAIWDACLALMQDPEQLVDQAFYAKTVQNGDFLNITSPCAELPEGEMLVLPEDFQSGNDAVVAVRGKAKAKPVATKKNGKKSKK